MRDEVDRRQIMAVTWPRWDHFIFQCRGILEIMTSAKGSLVGTTVGHFQLTRLIGEGGMGEVYEGLDTLLNRRVAIKTVRQERRFDEVSRARFFREARILSSLDHPHICRVYEYLEGVDVDFLVLEFIEGSSLRNVLKAGIDSAMKLNIALQMASALVAAHERGIVHRDIKPDNILLTADGVVKVLDFGLSRTVDDDFAGFFDAAQPSNSAISINRNEAVSDQTQVIGDAPNSEYFPAMCRNASASKTRTYEVIGTPTYMSPEQAACDEITTASDMFSLGLVLHEVFTGVQVFDRGLSLTALLLHIQEGRYKKISGVDLDLGILIEALKSHNANDRPTAGETLRRLEWIRDKPKRRRRRVLLVASMTFLVIIAVALGFLSIRLNAAAKRANREAHAAEQVTEFLEDLFRVSNPVESLGEIVTAREMLDRGAARLEVSLNDIPETRARLMSEIGGIYRNLGRNDKAADLLSHALEMQRSMLAPNHPDVIHTQERLGYLYESEDRYSEALEMLEPPLQFCRQHFGNNDIRVAAVGSRMANIYQGIGDPRADQLFAEMTAICDTAPESRELILTLNSLGAFAFAAGDVDHAGVLLGRAKEMGDRLLAADDPNLGAITGTLADIYVTLGRNDAAEKLLIRSLEIKEKVFGSDHIEVAKGLNALASFYARLGRYDDAEPSFLRARNISLQKYGSESLSTAVITNNLATIYLDRARYREAEELTKSALAVYRAKAPANPGLRAMIANLGTIYLATNRLDEAETAYEEALALLEHHTPGDTVNRGLLTTNLAETFLKLGRLDRAETLYADAYDVIGKALGFEHYFIGEILRGTALVQLEMGNIDEASQTVQRAGEILEASLGHRHVLFAQTLFASGRIDLARGDAASAGMKLHEAVQTLESMWGINSSDLIPVLKVYREALFAQGFATTEIDARIRGLH